MTPDDDACSPDPRAWEGWETPRPIPDEGLLKLLVADAAGRAAAMLAGRDRDQAEEEPLVDAIRILATPDGAPHVARAARLTGMPEDELRQLILAYRHGEAGGVAAAVGASACPPEELDTAVGEVRRNRGLAVGELDIGAGTIADPGAGVRIRLGPDGRWYPFTFARDRWWPAPGADASAGTAWQAALRVRSRR